MYCTIVLNVDAKRFFCATVNGIFAILPSVSTIFSSSACEFIFDEYTTEDFKYLEEIEITPRATREFVRQLEDVSQTYVQTTLPHHNDFLEDLNSENNLEILERNNLNKLP